MESLEIRTEIQFGGREIPRTVMLAVVQCAWMVLGFAVMQVLGTFTIENYYVLSYFGLVAASMMFAPLSGSKRSWQVVRWLLRLGLVGLSYVVALRAVEIVGI